MERVSQGCHRFEDAEKVGEQFRDEITRKRRTKEKTARYMDGSDRGLREDEKRTSWDLSRNAGEDV